MINSRILGNLGLYEVDKTTTVYVRKWILKKVWSVLFAGRKLFANVESTSKESRSSLHNIVNITICLNAC